VCLNWPYPQGRNHLRMTTRTNMDNSRHTGVAPQPASSQKALPQCGQPKGSPPRGNLITHYLPQPGGVPLTTPLTAVKSVRDSGSPLEGHPEVTSQGREHTSLPNGTRHGPCHSYAPARAPGPNGRTAEHRRPGTRTRAIQKRGYGRPKGHAADRTQSWITRLNLGLDPPDRPTAQQGKPARNPPKGNSCLCYQRILGALDP
jgi:hypothetical protein